jgi:hypothetical protein
MKKGCFQMAAIFAASFCECHDSFTAGSICLDNLEGWPNSSEGHVYQTSKYDRTEVCDDV